MLKGASSTLRVSLMERTANLVAQYTPAAEDTRRTGGTDIHSLRLVSKIT